MNHKNVRGSLLPGRRSTLSRLFGSQGKRPWPQDFNNVSNGGKQDPATGVHYAPRRRAFIYRGQSDGDEIPKPGEQKKIIHEGKQHKSTFRAVQCPHRCHSREASGVLLTFHSPLKLGLRRRIKRIQNGI